MRAVTFTGPLLASDRKEGVASAAASASEGKQLNSANKIVLKYRRFIDASPAYGKTYAAVRRSPRPYKCELVRAATFETEHPARPLDVAQTLRTPGDLP